MVAVLTDSHFFNGFSYGRYDDAGVNSRLVDIHDTHMRFVDECEAAGVGHILHGGDLYHRRNPSQIEIHWSLQWIDRAVSAGMHVWLVPGNHDHNLIRHAFAALEMDNLISDRVHVVDEPGLLDIGPGCYAVPFFRHGPGDADRIGREIVDLPPEVIVWGHAQPSVCSHGIEGEFNEREPMTIPSGVLDRAKARILLGHIHDRQDHVLGSCVRLTFGDSPTKWTWIGEDGTVGDGYRKSGPQPEFAVVRVDASDERTADEGGIMNALEREMSGVEPGALVHVVVDGLSDSDPVDMDAIRELSPDVRVVKHSLLRRERVRAREVVATEVPSLAGSLREWQKRQGYDGTERARLEAQLLGGEDGG